MSRKWLIALVAGAVLIPLLVFASVRGDLLKMGIDSDTESIVVEKDVTAGEDVVATGDVTSGDDVIVGDDCTIAGLATVGETLDVTGTTTLAVFSGKARILSFSGSKTITTAMSGAFLCNQDASASTTLTLPAAALGLTYTFSDVEAGANIDLWITAVGNDTINGGTAARSYKCVTDTVKHTTTLTAIDAIEWIVGPEVGTFANDNN